MILELTCSNFKSIKEEVVFSMLASTDSTNEEIVRKIDSAKQLRVLPTAVLYGANGSGKSNFLQILDFMCHIINNSVSFQPGDGLFNNSHKLALEEDTTIGIQFIKNNVRYAYGFSLLNNGVVEEYLYYFPNKRRVKIFERIKGEIIAGDRYKGKFELSIDALKSNRLFLSCIANFTNISEVENAFLFFKEDIITYNPNANNWKEYSIELLQKDKELKTEFIKIIQALGTGIEDIHVKSEKVNLSELPKEMQPPKEILAMLANEEVTSIEARVKYEQFETDLINEESEGINKLFELICPLLDILKKGKVLLCDELESSLHEEIVHEIIKMFQGKEKNKSAQLIFSTHDTSLLGAKLFRKDQIWFTEMNKERSTDLYSLAEIRNIRKQENLEKAYLEGKYGGIPMLNKRFFDEFEGIR